VNNLSINLCSVLTGKDLVRIHDSIWVKRIFYKPHSLNHFWGFTVA